MISVHPTFFYLLLEALAGITVLALVLGLIVLRRRRRRRAVLVELVQRIKNTGNARSEGITRVLRESGVSDDERLAALTQQVLTAETHFYQFLVRALLSNDERALLDLDRQVEVLTDAITRCSPALKNQPPMANSTSPAVTSQINAELGQIKQVVAALQSSHQQALAEVKSSVASLQDTLRQFASPGVIAVAAAAGTATVTTTQPFNEDVSATATTQDTLESLPDIDDTATPVSASGPSAPEPVPAPQTPAQAPDIEQIAEIPDELLMGASDTAASAEAAPVIDSGTDTAAMKLAAAPQQAPAEAEQIAAIPDELLFEETAAAEPSAPEAAATPAAVTPNPYQSDAEALIDDLLADAAATSKATLVATQAAPDETAAQEPSSAPELSVDEIYAAAPLIPDSDAEAALALSAETPAAPPEARKDEQEVGQGKSYGNVDDLLAELDDLLK